MIVQAWGYGRLIGCLAIATVLSLAVFGLFSGTVSLSGFVRGTLLEAGLGAD
jgi:hypothetical protein